MSHIEFSKRISTWGVRPAVLVVLVGVAASTASAQELPAAVRDVLRSNAESLSSVTIEWTETISSPLDLDDLWKLTTLKPGNVAFLRPRGYRYVRDGEKFFYHFKEYRQVPPEPPYIDWHDWALDGTLLYEFTKTAAGEEPGAESYTPLFTVRELANVSRNDSTKNTPYVRCLYLQAAGFYVPTYGRELDGQLESAVLHLIESGATITSMEESPVDDIECLRVEVRANDRSHIFYLDPAKRYAVIQYEEATDGNYPLAFNKNSEFKKVGTSGLWLPRLIGSTWYAWHDWYNWLPPVDRRLDTPVVTVEMEATTLQQTTASDADFAIDVKSVPPGTLVGDERLAGAEDRPNSRVSYIVPPDPAMLEQAARDAERWKPGPPPPANSHSAFLLTANVALIAILIGIFIWRRRGGGSS